MDTKHTPTPWKIENESIDKEGRQGYRIGNPKLGIVFDMVYTGHFAADNPEAHAAFIVKAVNSHATLLREVKFLYELSQTTNARIEKIIAEAEEK